MVFQVLIVTSEEDSGEGSLRSAIASANEVPGKDLVLVASDIRLESPIQITDSLYVGTPFGSTIEQTGLGRIFDIDDGNDSEFIDVSLHRLNLVAGNDRVGGGVFSAENLIISDSTFSKNVALDIGGGLYQKEGSLDIFRTKFEGNESNGTLDTEENLFGGGGIYLENVEEFTISQSEFDLNKAAKGSSIAGINSIGDIFNTTTENSSSLLAFDRMYFENSSIKIHFDFG